MILTALNLSATFFSSGLASGTLYSLLNSSRISLVSLEIVFRRASGFPLANIVSENKSYYYCMILIRNKRENSIKLIYNHINILPIHLFVLGHISTMKQYAEHAETENQHW